MSRGQRLFPILGCWALLQAVAGVILAEEELPVRAPANSRTYEYLSAGSEFHFGVMGEVARPGAYVSNTPRLQLAELIAEAGGLTQNATNQIRIVRRGNAGQLAYLTPALDYPLVAGDIIVADGPIRSRIPNPVIGESPPVQSSDSHRQVALVDLVNRPVILPVPLAHASLSAILKYLGQDAGAASTIKTVPVGPLQFPAEDQQAESVSFPVPTVLYFNPREVRRDRLPVFPPVYRIGESPLPGAKEPVRSKPEPPLATGSEIEGPVLKAKRTSEPDLITRIRELEGRIPTPGPIVSESAEEEPDASPRVALVPGEASPKAGEETAGARSWWPYLGLLLVLLSAAGFAAKLRRRQPQRESAPLWSFRENTDRRRESFAASNNEALDSQPLAEVPLSQFTADVLNDDVLSALVQNQLPVRHEPGPPIVTETPEDNPKSRRVFRVDPPEEKRTASVTGPYVVNRPQPAARIAPKPATAPAHAAIKPPHANEKTEPEISEPASLLDRVLRQVNQTPAA